MPTIKEKSKKGREKTKEITHDGVEKTKEVRNAASEKVKELKRKLNKKDSSSESQNLDDLNDTNGHIAPTVLEKKDFNVEDLDFQNNIYVVHQTLSSNIDSIMQNGLRTIAGLNGTSLFANKERIIEILNMMEEGRGHRGSDALVIMKFPKETFKRKEKITLDDISEQLIDL